MSDKPAAPQAVITWKTGPQPLHLPSGSIFYVRNRTVQTLMFAGILPMELTKIVQNMDLKQVKAEGVDKATAEAIKEYYTILFREIVVSPKVTLESEPKEGEISVADIPEPDLAKIIKYFQGDRSKEDAEKLESFRPESDGAGPGLPVQEVSPAPVAEAGAAPEGPAVL
ncbi:MAG: hypothetical protein OEW15_18575 [Nitrospirota bacterium]|nr:hypothetical protein [Nitrospirota bacterium]